MRRKAGEEGCAGTRAVADSDAGGLREEWLRQWELVCASRAETNGLAPFVGRGYSNGTFLNSVDDRERLRRFGFGTNYAVLDA